MSAPPPPRLLSKRALAHNRLSAAKQQRNGGPSTASIEGGSSAATSLDWAVGALAVVTLAITGVKLYKAMRVDLNPGKVAVVYNARRRTIFATPMDHCGTFKAALAYCRSSGKARKEKSSPRIPSVGGFLMGSGLTPSKTRGGLFTLSSLKLLLGAALFPATPAYITRPPLPWFKVFEVPRAVLNSEEGIEMACEVSDVPTKDGTLVDVDVTIKYYIDLNRDLERYLSVCGPVPPSGQVGKVIGFCIRSHASGVDAGLLISPQRREKYFMNGFVGHVNSKLLADCAVRVISVRVDRVVELQQ